MFSWISGGLADRSAVIQKGIRTCTARTRMGSLGRHGPPGAAKQGGGLRPPASRRVCPHVPRGHPTPALAGTATGPTGWGGRRWGCPGLPGAGPVHEGEKLPVEGEKLRRSGHEKTPETPTCWGFRRFRVRDW